jgi:hypothetical protein
MICHIISVYIHLFWMAPASATPLSKGHHQASGTMKTKELSIQVEKLWRSTDQGWVLKKYPKL